MIVKVLIVGWVILILAILLNFLAGKLGITSWYPFLDNVSKNGIVFSFQKLSIISILFLFVAYPGLLGFSAVVVAKALK